MNRPSQNLDQFIAGLPLSYRERYELEDVEAHFAAAAQREPGQVKVVLFRVEGPLAGVCVLADDAPGLLARITQAVVSARLEVLNAEVFTRKRPGGREAVDIFWLRRADGEPCGQPDIQQLGAMLNGERLARLTPEPPPVGHALDSGPTSSNSRVRFLEDASGLLNTLEIETEDRTGLLLSLTRALYALQVQILHSEVVTRRDRVHDRFQVAELNGSPVAPERRLEIQVAILSAAEPAKRLSSKPPATED